MDRKDAAHGHESEAEEKHAVLRDLDGGNGQQRREAESEQGDRGDHQEVLPRHDEAGVDRRVRQQPGEDAGVPSPKFISMNGRGGLRHPVPATAENVKVTTWPGVVGSGEAVTSAVSFGCG